MTAPASEPRTTTTNRHARGGGLLRAALLGLLLALTSSLWTAALPRPALAAAGDLTYITNALYQVQPASRLVHVVLSATATSHTKDSATRKFTIPGANFTLMPTTANFAASAGGKPLKVSARRTSPDSAVTLGVTFGRPLGSGQSYAFQVQFDLVDTSTAPSRTVHLGKTLVSFPVWAFATSGTPGSTVTVQFPAGYSVNQDVGTMTSSTGTGGGTVMQASSIADADLFFAWLTADTSPTYKTMSLPPIGAIQVNLRYWPDDPGWADAVTKVVKTGLPALEKLIGLGDPPYASLTIDEVSSRTTGGYSGIFDPSTGFMEVSYLADPFVILHESTHLWFNRALAADRWADEAFASYYASQVLDELNITATVPELTPDLLAAKIQLNDWAGMGNPGSTVEGFAYAATLKVATLIAQRAGPAGLAVVWNRIADHEAAYQPVHSSKQEAAPQGPPDWRQLLDYLEQDTVGTYVDIWRDWIVDAGQLPLLDQRAAARTAYHRLIAAAGAWELPAQIRQAMDTWQFGPAQSEMSRAVTTLAQRDEIVRQAAAEGTTTPDTLRRAFEGGTVAGAADEAQAELGALAALASARRAQAADAGLAWSVGLLGSDPTTVLGEARQAFARGDLASTVSLADSARAAWQEAADLGQRRLVVAGAAAGGVAVLLVALIVWYRFRRRRWHVPAAAAATAGPGGGSETAAEEPQVAGQAAPDATSAAAAGAGAAAGSATTAGTAANGGEQREGTGPLSSPLSASAATAAAPAEPNGGRPASGDAPLMAEPPLGGPVAFSTPSILADGPASANEAGGAVLASSGALRIGATADGYAGVAGAHPSAGELDGPPDRGEHLS